MKKLIKTSIVCLATLLSCMSTSFASAINDDSYDPLDVNHDNSIDMADVITVQLYLKGNLYCPTYNQLDANQSSTVDYNDVMYIQNYLLYYSNLSDSYYSRASQNSVQFPTISGFTPDGYASSTNSRTYKRYSYVSSQELSNYSLTPSTNALLDENMDIVLGSDERYEAYGYENTGIVRISNVGGTGFIVGDHVIATAAHCVYSNFSNTWYSIGIQTYNANGTLSGTTLTPIEAHIPEYYDTYDSTEYDYALITVEEDLSNYIQFALGEPYNADETNYESIPLYLTGCPGSTIYGNNSNNKLYSSEGHVSTYLNTNILRYDIDSSSGQSGSPVYTITRHTKGNSISYTYTALAIHSGAPSQTASFNWGPMITKYQLQFFLNNPYLSYTY